MKRPVCVEGSPARSRLDNRQYLPAKTRQQLSDTLFEQLLFKTHRLTGQCLRSGRMTHLFMEIKVFILQGD